MRRVYELVRPRQVFKEGREIPLGDRMERQPGFVEQENRIVMRPRALDEKNQIEAQKPLQPGAAAFQLDVFRPFVVGYPDAEIVTIRLKAKSVGALPPPFPEQLRQVSGGRLEENV